MASSLLEHNIHASIWSITPTLPVKKLFAVLLGRQGSQQQCSRHAKDDVTILYNAALPLPLLSLFCIFVFFPQTLTISGMTLVNQA